MTRGYCKCPYLRVSFFGMDTLRTYLNSLPIAEQGDFARRSGTSIGYLRKALSVKPRIDAALARRLDEESRGAVSRYELRPDVFGPAPDERDQKAA